MNLPRLCANRLSESDCVRMQPKRAHRRTGEVNHGEFPVPALGGFQAKSNRGDCKQSGKGSPEYMQTTFVCRTSMGGSVRCATVKTVY